MDSKYQVSPKLLKDMAKLAKHVSRQCEKASPFRLSKKQAEALDDVLRTLDARNEYNVGNKLRKAFGVELDGLRSKK